MVSDDVMVKQNQLLKELIAELHGIREQLTRIGTVVALRPRRWF